ncbi:glycosyltransferase family 2 protein [Allopontixanthobacter sediminis]|uniref:Glycosyltransferase n=1 Tax=Allopontixanthobacter sediminis TaxID=1689985 RepID=A0A845AYP9_9SPHN|nr:glycosyltransferase family 2 protein [Allopontixanthobacter sediminis]MXP44623.1 glycosyltransferase [Allopontixanthobacter sediminis]
MVVVLCWFVALPVIMALCIFSAETIFGAVRLRSAKLSGDFPVTTILMPAHNEAEILQDTLERLAPTLTEDVQILVVADNCSDSTAQIVKRSGFAVIERMDPMNKGKGYALACGRDHLKSSPPECIIILDADCQIDALSIEALAKTCIARNLPIQAKYILKADHSARPNVQISNFAFWLKNVVRQRGACRLGGPALLTGSGMAFPWTMFEKAPLDTANIVEDLALGIHLSQTGYAPIFLEQATTLSAAAGESATFGQRTRWEHGFLAMAKSHGLSLLGEGIRKRNRKLFQLGLHLLVPPLAFLMLAGVATLILLGLIMAMTGYWLAFAVVALCLIIAVVAVLLNWIIEGRQWLSFAALLRLPLYLAWKLPVYWRLAKGHTAEWNRTERPNDAGHKH